jgi:hypothetical protein
MTEAIATDVGPFAMVPDWILRAPISDRALRVFGLLARYADRGNEAFPARSTLARALRTSVDSVDRAMKELVALGVVTIEQRHREAGDQTSNLYRLRFLEHVGAAHLRHPSHTDAAPGSRTPAATPAAPVRHRTITKGTRTSGKDGAEPEIGSAATTAVLRFETVGVDARMWDLSAGQIAAWQEAYPSLNVLTSCRRAHAWLEANPVKRKTARGMPRFLVNWLNGDVQRGFVSFTGRGATPVGSFTGPAVKSAADTRADLDRQLGEAAHD